MPLPMLTAGLLIGVVAPAATAQGPQRDLREDVEQLHIRHRTAHYALAGTVSMERFAEYGRCLEFIHAEYASGFLELLGRPAPTPPVTKDSAPEEDERYRVVILATTREYDEFTAAYFQGHAEHTRGLYVPGVKLLIIRDAPDMSQTYEVLFHEAFHQFVDRHLPLTPVWINEGLATYYGTARATARGLVFDRPASVYFQVVRDAAGVRELIPLDQLMRATIAAFYDRAPVAGTDYDRRALMYAQAYTLTAFMLHDLDGKEHLRGYLRAIGKARSTADVRRITDERFGAELRAAMVPEWLNFVNRH